MCKDGIFYTRKYFQFGTCAQPLHNVTPNKNIFIRAAPRQTGIALDHPVQKFRCVCVCVSTRLSSWPMGWAICDFWPFLLLPHFSSEMPMFVVRTTRGPRTGSQVDPEPARFLAKHGPQTYHPAKKKKKYIYIICATSPGLHW